MAKTEVKTKAAETEAKGVQGWNVKLKVNEIIKKAVISHEGKRYYAKGVGSDGTKMCVILNEEKALNALAKKWGTKGQWD